MFTYVKEIRVEPIVQDGEIVGERTLAVYTVQYAGEDYFADALFALNEEQKAYASDYYVSMTNVKFFMAEVNKYHAYRAFKASPLAADVREPIHSVEDALSAFGYIAENDAEDNIIGLQYNGEKLGNEKELFDIIAPNVRSGSFIEMMGEDHSVWRWVFTDGTLEEITPKIEW